MSGVCAVFSRGDPYFGEDIRAVLEAVQDPDRVPEYRPTIPVNWPAGVQALMQVAAELPPPFIPLPAYLASSHHYALLARCCALFTPLSYHCVLNAPYSSSSRRSHLVCVPACLRAYSCVFACVFVCVCVLLVVCVCCVCVCCVCCV